MDSWSEADDRVIQGYNLQFNDADGYLAAADPNPAVLNPAYEGGFLRREALPAAYSNTMTFSFTMQVFQRVRKHKMLRIL